jgi:hypothetical protein
MFALVKGGCAHDDLCVLRIAGVILDLPNVIIADSNASSDYVRFDDAPGGVNMIDHSMTFALSWEHPHDQVAEWKHKSRMCAEVLVPNSVPADYIVGAYVSCRLAKRKLRTLAPSLAISINANMFFR